jgi:hypothetical protein
MRGGTGSSAEPRRGHGGLQRRACGGRQGQRGSTRQPPPIYKDFVDVRLRLSELPRQLRQSSPRRQLPTAVPREPASLPPRASPVWWGSIKEGPPPGNRIRCAIRCLSSSLPLAPLSSESSGPPEQPATPKPTPTRMGRARRRRIGGTWPRPSSPWVSPASA